MKKTETEKSKWKAALQKGMHVELKGDENILYLGASSGTTVSMIAPETTGTIFAVEKSHQMAIPLIKRAHACDNIAPLFCDAQDTDYMGRNINGEDIHILFCDIPAAHQVALLTKASELVTPECKIFFSLKTQSIRQDTPEKIYEDVKNELEKHFTIVESQSLEPYHKKHYFFVLRKK